MASWFGRKKTEIIKLNNDHENIALQSVNDEDFERDKPFVFLEEENIDDESLENETNITVEAHQTAQNNAEFIRILTSENDYYNKFFEMLRKDEGLCHRSLDEDGNKALHIATKAIRDTATVEKPANLHSWCDDYVGSIVQEIISRSPNQITMQNSNGETPLLHLAASGLSSVFQKIAQQLKVDSASFNICDNQGNTPLHCVVFNADSLDLAMYLVKKDANLMARNKEGQSPLFYAVQRGWPPASTEALEEEDLTEEKMQELNIEAEKQSWYRKFFHAAMKEKPRHPLEMVATGSDLDEPEHKPFILAMWEASPVAANIIFQQLESDKSFERGTTYVKYNYAINQDGYNFMLSGGQEGVLYLLENDTGVFVKKAPIKAMLDFFWDYSIRKIVLMEMVVFLWVLISASVMINLAVVAKSAGETHNSVAQKAAASVFAGFVVIGTIALMTTEFYHATHQGMGYVTDYWNYPDWVSSLTIMYMSLKYLITQSEWDEWERNVLAVGILYMWMKTLEFASAFERTSPIARLFLRMLQTIFQYLVMILVFILAFSHSFYLVLSDTSESYSNVPKAMITLYRGMMGDFDYDPIEQSSTFLATLLFIAYTLTGIILLLNLLIALMTNVYEEVKSDIETAYLQSKANMIAKKLRVYILGSATSTIIHKKLLLTRLHEWQLPLPDENKWSPVQQKWAQFIRATLFRPDRFQMHPSYREWFQGEEYRYGVVVYPIKNDQDHSQEVQIQGLRTKMSQANAKLNKNLGSIKSDIKTVRSDIESTHSTLVTLRDKATVSDIAKQITSTNEVIRMNAIHHVRQFKPKDEKIVIALLGLMSDKSSEFRRQAIIALGDLQVNDDRVQHAFLLAMQDPSFDVVSQALYTASLEHFKPSIEVVNQMIKIFYNTEFSSYHACISRVVMAAQRCEPENIDIVLKPFTSIYDFDEKERYQSLQLLTRFEEDEKIATILLNYLRTYWPSSELVLRMVETFGNLAPYIKRWHAPEGATEQDFINNKTCISKARSPLTQEMRYCSSCYKMTCKTCEITCHEGHTIYDTYYPSSVCNCTQTNSNNICCGTPNDELRELVIENLKHFVSQEGNRPVKLATVDALKKIGNYPSVYAALEIAMNDRDDAVRSAALQNMYELSFNHEAREFLKGVMAKREGGHLARACVATIFQQLCSRFGQMEDVKEILVAGLHDKYWAVRANCCSALAAGQVKDDPTIEGIVRLVRDKKPQVSIAAVKALSSINYVSSKLISVLSDLIQVTDNLDLKTDIVSTFTTHCKRGGFIYVPSSIKNTSSDIDSDLAICKQEGYCQLVVEAASYSPKWVMTHTCHRCKVVLCDVCGTKCHQGHPITPYTTVSTSDIFCQCFEDCACKTPDLKTKSKLKRIVLNILSSKPSHKLLVLHSLEALSVLGARDETAAAPVFPYLTDVDPQVKLSAIAFFMSAVIKNTQILLTLIELLSDDKSEVRVKACDALIQLGKYNTTLIDPLIHVITTGKTFGRINAVIAIANLVVEDPRIPEAFIKCLRAVDDPDLRIWICESWVLMAVLYGTPRTKAVYALVEAFQGERTQHLDRVLKHWEVEDREYQSMLVSMLFSELSAVRRAGAIALSKTKVTDVEDAVESLKQVLNDPDDSVKKAAQVALKQLSGKQ